ncbi:MAG: hypothetical protein ACREFC_12595 [Stellaceae bacterium]
MNATTGWRIAVPIGGALVLAVFAWLYAEFPASYHAILVAWGVAPHFLFLDTHAVLAALDCAREGLDPYHYNPCDVLTRAYNYSPLILEASALPVTRSWNTAVGVALALIFFVCVASLPAPRTRRDGAIMALALLSTMTAFAIERGNIDLLIFALITAAGHALRGRVSARAGAYALLLFAGLLKFYPLAALAVALREKPSRFAAATASALAALVLFALHYRSGLEAAWSLVPVGSPFTDLFGAENLPRGLTRLLSPLTGESPLARLGAYAVLALLIFYAVRNAVAMTRHAAALARLPDATWLFFVLGSALIVGCFFAGQSIGYRGIHFLFVLPGLLALSRAADAPAIFFRTAALIVFLMWGEAFREALQHHVDPANQVAAWQTVKAAFWLFRELVWWRVIGALAGLLLCFAMSTEMARFAFGARAAAWRKQP